MKTLGGRIGLGLRLAFLAVALAGCGSTDEATSKLEQGLPVDTTTLKVEVPNGVGLHQTAIATTSSLEVSDRSQVIKELGVFATVTNVGSTGAKLGVEAQSGDFWSLGRLLLQNRAQVNGNAHAPSGVDRQPGSVVTGVVDTTTPITSHAFSWKVDFQRGTTPVPVEPDKLRTLAAGAYTDVAVKARGTLALSTGTYYLQSLGVESGATVTLDTRQGPIFVYVSQHLHHRGLNRYTGDDNAALFAYLGTESVALGGPFTGSVVAPSAELALSPGTDATSPNRGKFKGSFLGKRVWVQPDITLIYAAFKHWDFLLPPAPFTVCVSKVGHGRYAALFGYENPLDRVASIPSGASNSLTGVLASMPVPPVSTFQPGRVEQALWVPFSSEVTWSIRGKSAKATPTSPQCPASAYPNNPTPLAQSGIDNEGPSQDIAPSTPKAPDFYSPPAVSEAEVLARMQALPTFALRAASAKTGANGTPVAQQIIGGPGGSFIFKLTSIHVPDGDTGSHQEPYVSPLKINGVEKSVGSLGSCEEDTTCSLNITVEEGVPFSQRFVDVAIDIREDDDSSKDDDELQVRLVVDNTTGMVVSGSAHSTDPDTTNNIAAGAGCGGAEGWTLCWEIQTEGAPVVEGDTSICGFWNAYFVDEGQGESRQGIPVPQGSDPQPPKYRAYPAAFAKAKLMVRSAFSPAVDLPLVSDGFLDQSGCMKIASKFLVHRTEATTVADGDLSIALVMQTTMSAPGGVVYNIRDTLTLDPAYVPPPPPQKKNPEDPLQWLIGTMTMGTPNVVTGGKIQVDDWAQVGSWRVPPATLQVFQDGHTPMTNTAAAISSLLTSADPGIVAGTYEVAVNAGLLLSDGVNIDSTGGSALLSVGPAHTNSECARQNAMTGKCEEWTYIKPACTTSADCQGVSECLQPVPTPCFDPTKDEVAPAACMNDSPCNGAAGCYCRLPHQSRWKYVLTHEAGHQIQHRAAGSFGQADYGFICPMGTLPGSPQCPGNLSQYTVGGVVDPPWITDTCGCSHVHAANQEHCLQSVERSGAAQTEGVAQFYASRSWNQDASDCTFTYYKEFLDTTCRNPNAKPGDCKPYRTRDGRDLISTLPPAAVSCRQPARWRNKQECGIVANSSGKAGDYGTEYDWMGFLYNINRPTDAAAPRVPTGDIWLIYRHACTQAEAAPGAPPKAVPDMCLPRPFVWDATSTTRVPETTTNNVIRKVGGFRQGVEAQYAASLATIVAVTTQANIFGVGSDTNP